MSRLMADQENRGDDGDLGSSEDNSVMVVNLAEGCEAVNDQTHRLGFYKTYVSLVHVMYRVCLLRSAKDIR